MDGDDAFDTFDPKLEALLKQELAGARGSEEHIMAGLSAELKKESPPATRRHGGKPPAIVWQGYLAAAVMLALIVGLFALLTFGRARNVAVNPSKTDTGTSTATGPAQNVSTSIAAGTQTGTSLDKNKTPKEEQPVVPPHLPPLPRPPLTDEDIPQLIKELSGNDLELRARAANRLLALGLTGKAAVNAEYLELQKRKALPADLAPFVNVLGDFEKQEQAEIAKVNSELERPDSGALYLPPDKEIAKLLQRKVTFEFVDTSLDEAINFIRQVGGVHVALDASLNAGELPNINLRVTEMSLELALDWIVRLGNLEAVPRGSVVFLTTHERALRLKTMQIVQRVPLRKDEAAWRLDDTQAICELLGPGVARASAPGEITVAAGAEQQARINATLKLFAEESSRPAGPPPWALEMDLKLTRQVNYEYVDQSFQDAINFLNSLTRINIVMDPALVAAGKHKTPITQKVASAPLSDALAQMCALAGVAATYRDQAIFITKAPCYLEASLCVFDLRPALKAGVAEADIVRALEPLTIEGQPVPLVPARTIRSYYCATVDPWTAERINTMLDGAAQSGKLPPVPAAPWFFKTLKLTHLTPNLAPNPAPEKDIKEPVAPPPGGDGF